LPLFNIKYLNNETRLGIWKVEESINDLQSKLILNREELNFFNNLKKGKRNLHWLAGRVMLRNLLETNKFIDVKEDAFGKPYLQNFDFELSITHSYDYAAVIISKSKVGIDIEKMKKDLTFLAPKFLTFTELNDLNETHRIKQLYVYWCAKECIYKLYGKKELAFKNNIVVKPFQYSSEGSVHVMIHKDNLHKEYEVNYEELVPGYMLAYVSESA
jgi:4'-phosphopantetheinyl transferase